MALSSLIRHSLTLIAAWLISRKALAPEHAEAFVVNAGALLGAGLALAAVLSKVGEGRLRALRELVALRSPADTPAGELRELRSLGGFITSIRAAFSHPMKTETARELLEPAPAGGPATQPAVGAALALNIGELTPADLNCPDTLPTTAEIVVAFNYLNNKLNNVEHRVLLLELDANGTAAN